MKLWIIPIILTTLLITGGCAMSTPDTRAFQDDFTREFMDSPREVEEGYYLFKSKTDGYTMLFPINGGIHKMPYERHQEFYEGLRFGTKREGENISYSVKLTYENRGITEHIDINLGLLNDSLSYDGDYEEFEYNGKTYYYAKNELSFSEDDTTYWFFSYVKSNESHQAVEFVYSVSCSDKEKPCQIDVDEEEEHAKMLMKSIEFQ